MTPINKIAFGLAALCAASHAEAASLYSFDFQTLGGGQVVSGLNSPSVTTTYLTNVVINFKVSTSRTFMGSDGVYTLFLPQGGADLRFDGVSFSDGSTVGRYDGDRISAKACFNNAGVGSVPILGTFSADPSCGSAFILLNDDITSITSYLGAVTSLTVSIVEAGSEGSSFVNGVPEPSTWALMLAGFGLVGYALRRKRDRYVQGMLAA